MSLLFQSVRTFFKSNNRNEELESQENIITEEDQIPVNNQANEEHLSNNESSNFEILNQIPLLSNNVNSPNQIQSFVNIPLHFNDEENTYSQLNTHNIISEETNFGLLKTKIQNNQYYTFLMQKHVRKNIFNIITWILLIIILLCMLCLIVYFIETQKIPTPYPALPYHEFQPLKFENDSNVLQFFSFSDVHIDIDYHTQMFGNRNYSLGKMSADPPVSMLISSLEAMKRLNSTPAFITFLGDAVRHEETVESRFKQTYQLFKSTVNEYFPSTLILPVIGNHDIYPKKNYIAIEDNNPVLEFLGEMWSMWLPSSAVKSVKKGGFYAIVLPEFPNIRIISLNTIIYSDDWLSSCKEIYTKDECIAKLGDDPFDQFAFLNYELHNARLASQKVIIITHIGIGLSRTHKVQLSGKFEQKITEILENYKDVVSNIISGHSHRDFFNTLTTTTWSSNFEGIPTFYVPSITTVDSSNPSFRLNYLSLSSGEILDYQEAIFDLTSFIYYSYEKHVSDAEFWEIEYSFFEEFKSRPTAVGLNELFTSVYSFFIKTTDDENEITELNFQNYNFNNSDSTLSSSSLIDGKNSDLIAIENWEKMKYFFTAYYPKSFSSHEEIELLCQFLYFSHHDYSNCVDFISNSSFFTN